MAISIDISCSQLGTSNFYHLINLPNFKEFHVFAINNPTTVIINAFLNVTYPAN